MNRRATITLFALFSLVALPTSAAELKVDCHSLGGGYLTQGIHVLTNLDGNYEFSLERFSTLEDMKTVGLEFDSDLVKRMTFTIPKANCYTKTATSPQITLMACTTGISKIDSELELLDGKKKQVRLGDNNFFEVSLTTKETVSQSEQTVGARLTLGRQSPSSQTLGFHLRECRSLTGS